MNLASEEKTRTVMQDIDFVKQLLVSDYRTHLPTENPYPDLEQLIARTDFDFRLGKVTDERDNGSYNREGIGYRYFPDSDKRILVHRFIVAVALGKWPPRDLDVHHINNKPNNNNPTNLELVTRRDNCIARRAPLKKVADLNAAFKWSSRVPKIVKKSKINDRRTKWSALPNEQLNQIADSKSGPSVEDVLRDYYSIPADTTWTGSRKGKNDCYWEASTGVWHYVDPNL